MRRQKNVMPVPSWSLFLLLDSSVSGGFARRVNAEIASSLRVILSRQYENGTPRNNGQSVHHRCHFFLKSRIWMKKWASRTQWEESILSITVTILVQICNLITKISVSSGSEMNLSVSQPLPDVLIQTPILYCLSDVLGFDVLNTIQISDRTRDFQHLVVGACR